MSATISRRALLAASAPAMLSVGVLASPIQPIAPDLWRQHRALVAEALKRRAAEDAAIERLPAWAAPGPSSLFGTGEKGGFTSYWPETKCPGVPGHLNACRNIRPGLRDLHADFEQWRRTFRPTGVGLAAARAKYRERVRLWIARIREQRAEEAEVDLPRLKAKAQAASDAAYAVHCQILEQRGVDPASIAGRLIVSTTAEKRTDEPIHYACPKLMSVLADLRPLLTGGVAEAVDELTEGCRRCDDPAEADVTFGELSWWL